MPVVNISPELFYPCLQWLVIAMVWLVLAWGIYREDRQIRRLRGVPVAASDMAALLQMLHARHVQIGILVTLLLAAQAANDLHRAVESAPAPTLSHAAAVQPTMTPAPAALPAAPLPAATALPFSDITEFNEENSQTQAYLDWLKQRYEAWLVTYYYLNKCGQAGAQDLNLIEASLQKDLGSVHADVSVRANILLAASGSYQEMYRDIPCDGAHISATRSVYDAHMHPLRRSSARSASSGIPAAVP